MNHNIRFVLQLVANLKKTNSAYFCYAVPEKLYLKLLPSCNQLQFYSTSVSNEPEIEKKKVNKAMKAYLDRAKAYDEFMKKEKHDFQIGKRHLANMMGEDPETFTQADIDRAIEYLFPSGIYDRKARPLMKPPEEIIPPQKAAEFDESGRPHHYLFYTGKPNFYQILHEAVEELLKLNKYEDKMIQKHIMPDVNLMLNLEGKTWLSHDELSKLTVENLHQNEYDSFVNLFERLKSHPYAYLAKDFISCYCKTLLSKTVSLEIPKPSYGADGRSYVTMQTCRRKSCIAAVTVRAPGTGKISINGKGIDFFTSMQCREQVLFPLLFTNMLNTADVEAEVENGGPSGHAGAIRYGISICLRSFVDEDMMEKMRIAGLLTQDIRTRERKKPGQEGARRKYTWKKR